MSTQGTILAISGGMFILLGIIATRNVGANPAAIAFWILLGLVLVIVSLVVGIQSRNKTLRNRMR